MATAQAFGLGEADPAGRLVELLECDEDLAQVAATTLLHFVLGHVNDEQMNLQAGSVGAIDDDPLARADTFATGLGIVVTGIAVLLPSTR